MYVAVLGFASVCFSPKQFAYGVLSYHLVYGVFLMLHWSMTCLVLYYNWSMTYLVLYYNKVNYMSCSCSMVSLRSNCRSALSIGK